MNDEKNDLTEEQEMAELLRNAGKRDGVSQFRATRVRANVRSEWQKRTSVSSLRTWWALAAAAMVLVVVGVIIRPRLQVGTTPSMVVATIDVATGEIRGGTESLRAGSTVTANQLVETPSNARASLHLADGGSLRMDTNTRLIFEESRKLRLERGAVYFDSGGGRPIEVLTSFGEVQDIGTQFEVRLARDEMTVRVREGAVQVERKQAASRIAAGTELKVDTSGNEVQRLVAPDDPSWGWILEVAPPFRLEGATLAQFLEWVGRELGVKVRVADPDINPDQIVLHGSLEGLRPDQTVATVLPTAGLRAELVDGTLIVGRKP